MAMTAGDAAGGTGLAGALKTALLANDAHGNSTGAQAGNTLNAFCNQLANAIVSYVQGNATAHISTSLGGLQTSQGVGLLTTAPGVAADIPIT